MRSLAAAAPEEVSAIVVDHQVVALLDVKASPANTTVAFVSRLFETSGT
jgi:hypothetical protein